MYYGPPHPDLTGPPPWKCPKCGRELVDMRGQGFNADAVRREGKCFMFGGAVKDPGPMERLAFGGDGSQAWGFECSRLVGLAAVAGLPADHPIVLTADAMMESARNPPPATFPVLDWLGAPGRK